MADMSVIVEQIKDESRRKELRSHDEEEDYLDEGFAFTYNANVWCACFSDSITVLSVLA